MEESYAQALWQMVEKGVSPEKAVSSLKKVLEREGRAALLPKIGRSFARIAEKEQKKTGMTLYVGKEKDAKGAAQVAGSVMEALNVPTKEFDVKVDDSLIGGWRLEGSGILVDRSFKKQLLEMYNRATS